MGLDKKERALKKAIKESKKRRERRRSNKEFEDQVRLGDFDMISNAERTEKKRWD